MYFEVYKDWLKTRLEYFEASCIDEQTCPRVWASRAGGKHYRTYRTYKLDLKRNLDWNRPADRLSLSNAGAKLSGVFLIFQNNI